MAELPNSSDRFSRASCTRVGFLLGLWLAAFGLAPTRAARGQDVVDPLTPPDFDLAVEAPEQLVGEPGETLTIDAEVLLKSTPTNPEEPAGAEAWTLSVATSPGLRVLSATIKGTAADVPPVGYYEEGFRLTEPAEGEGTQGVISAIALSFFTPTTLPPESRLPLLRLTLETTVPEEGHGCQLERIEFRDGLRGQGQPVNNTITYRGRTRRDDGSERDMDADTAENASILVCSKTSFLRGDCSSDRNVDISDAIFLLGYLFLGSDAPSCQAACDSNGNDELDITDAIYELNHLFLGGPELPEPYPLCGENPAPGRLPCLEPQC